MKPQLNHTGGKQIDSAFREMATDLNYQMETELLLREFAKSDWETIHKSEGG